MANQPGAQGSKVVLLVSGDTYFEIINKAADGTITIMGPTGGQANVDLPTLQARGFAAKPAHKLVKTDGSWLYMTAGQYGVDIYLEGRYSPGKPLGMQSVRSL